MPSGKIHDKAALLSAVPVFFAGCFLLHFNALYSFVFTAFAVFSQLMFGPDLDVNSIQYKRWGIFRVLWFPYRLMFAHRSSFSHGIILGPVLRCLYLILVIFAFGGLFAILDACIPEYGILKEIRQFFAFVADFLNGHAGNEFFKSAIAGLFTGAAVHTLTDKIFSFFKNLL